MSDEKDHHYCKSFIAKGRILRNKCAQVKVQERYLNKQPHLFLQGKSTVPPPLDSTLIIPSCELFLQFQSILNFLPLSSSSNKTLLILQTVLRSALAKGDQKFQKTCKTLLYDTPSAARVLFLNETISDTCSDQQEKEPKDSYEIRLFIKACLHLQHTIGCSVVVLTCDQSDSLYEPSSLSGLCVETIIAHLENERQFSRMTSAALTNIIVSADEILAHYRRSKCTSSTLEDDHVLGSDDVLRMKKSTYSGHLSAAEVAIGIKNGTLLSGKIVIFPHNFLEAEVATAGGVTALVSGRSDLNRAMDGDEVVIRLHPKDKWKRILGSLSLIVQTDNTDPPDDMLNLEQLENEEKEAIKDDGGGAVMPAGMVVAIIKREVSEMVVTVPFNTFTDGSAKADSTNNFGFLVKESFIIVNPLDMRLPKMRLRTRQWSKLQGYRIVVAFDNWPQDSIFPNCHLVRVIGESNDSKTEVESILIRHSIFPRPFSASALACVPVVFEPPAGTETPVVDKPDTGHRVWRDSGWCMPTDQLSDLNCNDDYSFRRDYRDCRRVFSVDPPGCQDIDDAMSITWVEGKQGVIEVAVSIADVCAFLPQECALDLEAQARGTTVYLTHMRLNMLPSLISGDIASLHGGKDRFALTVVWHIAVTHADGKPVNKSENPLLLHDNKDIIFATPLLHSCGRTAIRSVAAMTYAQAHNLILGHDPDPVPSTVPPGQAGRTVAKSLWEGLRSDLRMLTVFGRYLKGQREKNGALDLTQTGGELKFKLDSEGDPMDVKCKEEMEVHNTIAELMIICNSTVAYIVESYKPLEALVRVHAPPPPDQQKEILRLVVETGQGIFDSGADVKLRNQLRSFRENMLFPKKKHAKADDKKTAESIVDFVTSSVIKSMCEALYVNAGSLSGGIFSCEGASVTQGETRLSGHYGLGLNYYTHFTSPIRRYADIMVHRQLLGILESLGCGSGLKQIQLPPKEGVINPNVCIDYSDRRNIQKDTQSSSTGGILPEGVSTDCTGPRALIPQSIVPELRSLVSPHDSTNQPIQQAPYVAPDFDLNFTENVIATSEDDLLNDLLSSSASTALQWDDSFLDNLLEGKTDDDDVEIRAKQLESCADNSLDFLLDHPVSSSSSSALALPSASTRDAKDARKPISASSHDTPDTRLMKQKGTISPYTSKCSNLLFLTLHLPILLLPYVSTLCTCHI
jgi:exoribonuclease R